MANDEPATLMVAASADAVRAALRARLSDEEMTQVIVTERAAGTSDPFAPQPRHDLPTLESVVTFTASAIAGGILYDVVKHATLALRDAFGDRLKTRGDAEGDAVDDEPDDD